MCASLDYCATHNSTVHTSNWYSIFLLVHHILLIFFFAHCYLQYELAAHGEATLLCYWENISFEIQNYYSRSVHNKIPIAHICKQRRIKNHFNFKTINCFVECSQLKLSNKMMMMMIQLSAIGNWNAHRLHIQTITYFRLFVLWKLARLKLGLLKFVMTKKFNVLLL